VCSHIVTCPTTSDFASWLQGARVLPHVSWQQLPPPSSGRLWCHHASRGASSHLPARGELGCRHASRGVSFCLPAPRVPPCVPWRQLLTPSSGQLGCRHVSHDALQTAGYQGIRIFPDRITIVISYRGVRISSKTPHYKAHTGKARFEQYNFILPWT
jgi:hypothetical protein